MRDRLSVPYVVNDLVIKEDSCNLACSYCLTGQSLFKEGHDLQQIFAPPKLHSCSPGTSLRNNLDRIMAAVEPWHLPVIKISGGEVMLLRGIMDWIEELSHIHETVVLLTNGLLLTEAKCHKLRKLGNIVLQISLDATTYAGNSYRIPSPKAQEIFMKRLDNILESGIAVEIYTVLNNRSIDALEQTLDDLLAYTGKVSVFPFPVRGPSCGNFAAKPEQVNVLARVLENWPKYRELLLNKEYIERVYAFYREGGRTQACHLPRVVFSSFDDGLVTSCPNIWFNHVGNLITKPGAVLTELKETPFRQVLLGKKPRIDACKACITPWEPTSLYFEGLISAEELAAIPMYRGPRTLKRMARVRALYYNAENIYV